MHPDVIVVGGGIIGTATAYYLAREGFRVTLLERKGLAAEASGSNVGLISLSTKPLGPLFELARTSIDMYASLEEELDFPIQYERTGCLHVFRPSSSWDELVALQQKIQQAGLKAEVLDAQQSRGAEPALSPEILGSVWSDVDGQAYPFAVTIGYAAAARRLGAIVEVGPDAEVLALMRQGDRVVGVETPAGLRPAGTVVLATGAWAAQLPAPLGLDVPVTPVRGHVMVTDKVPKMLHHVIFGGEPSARQTVHGNIIIGSTPEYAGFDKTVDVGKMQQFARGVLELFPGLANLNVIRAWTGLRPGIEDNMPVIGWAPGVEGLFLNVGHFRNGVCYAPASGRIVADMLKRGDTWDWAKAFRLERFRSVA